MDRGVAEESREKHFVVVKIIEPEPQRLLIEYVELEAVYSRRSTLMRWRDLTDLTTWRQRWL